MDLDHFKYVNDTLGHPIGDLLLRETAARLQSVATDEVDIVARLGGDEFALLLPGRDIDGARRFADAIKHALELPTTLQGHVVDVRASIGIAVFPEHGDEGSTLLRRADIAMYAAKRDNCGVAVWDENEDKHSSDRLSLLSDLRKAVDNDELTLAYQPKVMLRGSGGELYTEALVRWRHPTRGLVAPIEFIPFAEQTGYIRAITHWVLAHAIAQCAEWRFNGLPMNVSINLSARDLMDATLPDRVATLLHRHKCAAQWISLEITESAILDDPAHAIRNLERLHALGCRLAIDDYWHRLFVARLPAAPAGARAQDRQVIRHRHGDRCERRAHRALDDRPRAQHGLVGRRRRRRGRRDARPSAGHGLRHRAGLPAQPAAGRGRDGSMDARVGMDPAKRTAELAPRRLTARDSERGRVTATRGGTVSLRCFSRSTSRTPAGTCSGIRACRRLRSRPYR